VTMHHGATPLGHHVATDTIDTDDATPARAAGRCGVLLVGPLPDGPIVGGIANGIRLLLASRVAAETSMRLFNTARAADPSRSWVRKIAYQSATTLRFLWTVVSLRPRVVHVKSASYVNFYQSALYAFLARVLGRRVMLQLHGGDFRDFYDGASGLRKRIIRTALARADRVVALSDSWATYFTGVSGVSPVAVVPNALVTSEYRNAVANRARFRIPADRTAVLFVGTGSARSDDDKGFAELCAATARARLRHPELLLVVAGIAGESAARLNAVGAEGDGWTDVGVVAASEKASLYRSVDVFALPSRFENMPNTLLEAMAAGLPSIVTAVGAVPEMVEDGVTALLVPVGDADALTARLERLAADTDLRRRIGVAAADVAAARFDLATLEASLLGEYRRLGGELSDAGTS